MGKKRAICRGSFCSPPNLPFSSSRAIWDKPPYQIMCTFLPPLLTPLSNTWPLFRVLNTHSPIRDSSCICPPPPSPVPPQPTPQKPPASVRTLNRTATNYQPISRQSAGNQQPWAGRSSPASPVRIRSFPRGKREIARPIGSLVSLDMFRQVFLCCCMYPSLSQGALSTVSPCFGTCRLA